MATSRIALLSAAASGAGLALTMHAVISSIFSTPPAAGDKRTEPTRTAPRAPAKANPATASSLTEALQTISFTDRSVALRDLARRLVADAKREKG